MSPNRTVPVLLTGCLLLIGCASRPSVGELSGSIRVAAAEDPTVDVTADEASCIAKRLLDSGLSDTTLEGLADDFDSPEVLSAEVEQVEPAVAEAAAACIGGG
jgi:hypothetical protein